MTVESALAQWNAAHARLRESETRLGPLRLFWIALGPVSIPVPHPGQLRWHDLHHLALGYEPDLVGEMEVSAFELRTGVKTGMVLLLCLAGLSLGLLCAPGRTSRAWRRARGQRNLYGGALPYEQVLGWTVDELRDWIRSTA